MEHHPQQARAATAIATKPFGNVGLQIRIVSLERKGDSVR